MRVEIQSAANYVMGSIPKQSSLNELNKWTEILQEILKYSLDGSKVYMFTLLPQKYSLGYELGSPTEIRTERGKILVNYFEQCTDDQIAKVVNSEEFSRGLLKIVLTDTRKEFDDFTFATGDYSGLKHELVTCEDDGYSFYWYNPRLQKVQIEMKLNSIVSSVLVPN